MPSNRWLKAVPDDKQEPEAESVPAATPNVSMSDVRRMAQEKAARAERPPSQPASDWLTSQPVNQSLVNQSTSLVNQLTSPSSILPPGKVVNQLTSEQGEQLTERLYRSRRERRLKGIRLPVSSLDRYELWCVLNKVDFQEAVDFALNWLTSQPVNQLTGQLVNQLTTLINNDYNNELIINDEKSKRVFSKYTELTGKQVSKKDREAYGEVAHLDLAVITDGLKTAIKRATAAGSRVNSFRYAINCIHEVAKISAQPVASTTPPADASDYSQCPDCGGSGFWYPSGTEKGVDKCRHLRLGQTDSGQSESLS